MNDTEQRFWKFITWFGELPGILVPLLFIASMYLYNTYQRFSHSVGLDLSYRHGDFSIFTDQAIPLILGFGGVFMSYSIGTVIKYFYYKSRPIPRDTSTLWKRINAGSMPSIHSSNALIIAVAIVSMITTQEVSNYQVILLVMCSFLCYLSIALSRIALQKHYPIDVLAGTGLGILIILTLIMSMNSVISIIEKIISSIL